MFISSLGSSDDRFKTLTFKPGLNILVADRTEGSAQGDSRNSVGKTSFVKVLRYVLGGSRSDELVAPELNEHSFKATFSLPNVGGSGDDTVSVSRTLTPATKAQVSCWSAVTEKQPIPVEEWRSLQAPYLFHIPPGVSRPTSGPLWAQLVRTFFHKPTKVPGTAHARQSRVRHGTTVGVSAAPHAHAAPVGPASTQAKTLRQERRAGRLEAFHWRW